MSERKLNRLREAMDGRYAKWLETREPEICRALEAEIADGAEQGEIEKFAKEIGGTDQWFATKLLGASRHIQRRQRA